MAAMRKEDASMTSQEMLDRSSSWTLACDNVLLNRLKAFSENLSKNSEQITKECDTLGHDISNLDYRLRNVTNQFLMMANTQFVENRVEDFEEFSTSVSLNAKTSKSMKTKAETEAELISKMKQSIQLGLKACSNKRQMIEGANGKDRTAKFKRPFVIGSPKFFSSKFCGLVDETRRLVPSESFSDVDSIHSHSPFPISDINQSESRPAVTFTMPPPSMPVVPIHVVPEPSNNEDRHNGYLERGAASGPPSPTISEQSSDFGKATSTSNSNISRENVPRSVTDELNKMFNSFAPPAQADDDSDDDFRPNAAAGRIFDDDDDDLFREKDLIPSQKNSDFFSRTNPTQLPAHPVFSTPPPIDPSPLPKSSTKKDVQEVIGTLPKAHDNPNMSTVAGNGVRKDSLRHDASLPEGPVGHARPKLPPGAVSMFGGMPHPVFNSDKLQAAAPIISTTNVVTVPSLPVQQNTQINSIETRSKTESSASVKDSGSFSSGSSREKQHNANTLWNASQPNVGNLNPEAGKAKNTNLQGSLNQSKDSHRNQSKVPASSLFLDDSSDDDIFKPTKKPINAPQTQAPRKGFQSQNIQSQPHFSSENPILSTSHPVTTTVQHKPPIKKSIFDDSDSDDDLFGSASTSSSVKTKTDKSKNSTDGLFKYEPKKLTLPVKKVNGSSLFGDDSDSDSDLFGQKKVTKIKRTEPVNSGSQRAESRTAPPAKMDGENENSLQSSTFDEPIQPSSYIDNTDSRLNTVNTNDNNNKSQSGLIKESHQNEPKKSSSSEKVAENISELNVKSHELIVPPPQTKASIFDDTDSDDDLFSTKVTVKINKGSVDKTENAIPNDTITTLPKPKAGKGVVKVSLFDDESDSDSDLFISKSKKKPLKDEDKTKAGTEKCTSTNPTVKDGTVTGQSNNNETAGKASLDKEQLNLSSIDDSGPSASGKAVGSKISEKIKAMQNSSANSDISKPDISEKTQMKSKVSVKNLALNLNINPLALKVGAKPPKPGGSTPSTPEIDDATFSSSNENSLSASNSLITGSKTDYEQSTAQPTPECKDYLEEEKSIEDKNQRNEILDEESNTDNTQSSDWLERDSPSTSKNDCTDRFVEIIKARIKIQQKRKPPSRSFLKSLGVQGPATSQSESTGELGDKEDEASKDGDETDIPESGNSYSISE